MSIVELQILLDLHCGNELNVLEEHASWTRHGYLFIDSEDGQCYLFDENGKMDDIKKIKALDYPNIKLDIKKIVIPENVESVGESAFRDCTSLESIEIPESVKSIGYRTFANCMSLKSIKISKSVKSIGNYAFQNCTSLQSIEIPESVKSIGLWAFAYCTSLKSIEIPKNVKSIEDGAFYYCISLKSIKISDSIKSIGEWAFEYCASLEEVIFKGKTMKQVKRMNWYPWGIEDESIIKCS